ncbi:hypothetical protein FRB98_008634 [Tulasnella sp. 332]|nr:hypothetical protein FRB98_008634 [Tulasnella sp. 332]
MYNSYEEQGDTSEIGGYTFPRAATTGALPQTPQFNNQSEYPNAPPPRYPLVTPVSTASHTPSPYGEPSPYSQWPQQESHRYEPSLQSTDRGFIADVDELKAKTKKKLKTTVSAIRAALHLSQPRPDQQPPSAGALNVAANPDSQSWSPRPDLTTIVAMPQAQQATGTSWAVGIRAVLMYDSLIYLRGSPNQFVFTMHGLHIIWISSQLKLRKFVDQEPSPTLRHVIQRSHLTHLLESTERYPRILHNLHTHTITITPEDVGSGMDAAMETETETEMELGKGHAEEDTNTKLAVLEDVRLMQKTMEENKRRARFESTNRD